jgi:hypothetical protein
MRSSKRWFARLRNSEGVALPLALFGLGVVTLIVTTMLLTSTSETALSHAHRDATQSFYGAEGALQSYVALEGANFAAMTGGNGGNATATVSVPGGGSANITVTSLGAAGQNAYYSVVAEPSGGGRTVAAIITVVTTNAGVNVTAQSAVTVGNTIDVISSAFISGVNKRTSCEDGTVLSGDDTASVGAIRFTNDAEAPKKIEDTTIECKEGTGASACIKQEDYGQNEILQRVFGVSSFEALTAYASKKFGDGTPHTWGTEGLTVESFTIARNGSRAHRDTTHSHNLGCPVTTRPLKADGTTADGLLKASECSTVNANYWPITEINVTSYRDVKLYGHAQGMIIVKGGNVEVGPDFKLKGIIVAEGKISMDQRAVVVGAVVGKGDAHVGNQDAKTEIDKVTMQFDRCAIHMVEQALANSGAGQGSTTVGRTERWFEVFR